MRIACRSAPLAVLVATLMVAWANVSEASPPTPYIVSPGFMVARATSGDWRWDGELSTLLLLEDKPISPGAAVGGNRHRLYAEAQLAHLFEGDAAGMLALNPKIVIDGSRGSRVGAQLTAWGVISWVRRDSGIVPVPVVLFARAELFGGEHVISFGLMFKLPIPVNFPG
jgi:hypothetical protein